MVHTLHTTAFFLLTLHSIRSGLSNVLAAAASIIPRSSFSWLSFDRGQDSRLDSDGAVYTTTAEGSTPQAATRATASEVNAGDHSQKF